MRLPGALLGVLTVTPVFATPPSVDGAPTEGTMLGSGNVTTSTLTYPATIADNDLIVLEFCIDGDEASSPTSVNDSLTAEGFSAIGSPTANSTNVTSFLAYRYDPPTTDGGTTFDITHSAENTSWVFWRLSGAQVTDPPEVARTTGADTNPNPPSLAPAGGADDYTFIVSACVDGSSSADAFSVFPTGYADTGQINEAGASASTTIGYGSREATNVTTEDPSAMTKQITQSYVVSTVAVYPLVSGGTAVNIFSGRGGAAAQPIN